MPCNSDALKKIKHLLSLLVGLLIAFTVQADEFVFTPIHVSHGLSDNQVRSILQLPDGRMVFTTSGNLNLYDGARFTYIHRLPEHVYPLNKYDGYYHIYQSDDSLLWVKDWHKLMCVDLRKEKYVDHPETYFHAKGVNEPVDDFFMDTEHRMWLLTSRGLLQPDRSLLLTLPSGSMKLQDLIAEGDQLYLFFHTGEVVCYDLSTGQQLYTCAAYPASEQASFRSTSLVVKGQDGFYQLRNGSKGGFFYFNPQTRTWKKLLERNYNLNTLIVTPEEIAYVSCAQGIWKIDPRNGQQEYLPTLKMVDGRTISTEISTIFYDRQGGLWVGTFNRGLLYYHPLRYTFTQVPRAEADLLPEEVRRKFSENKGQRKYNGRSYTALCTDSRGWTWAGTPDGLALFTAEGQSPRMFYTEDGLANNFVHALLEDRSHRIWVTTSYGISQIQVDATQQKIHFINYNAYDGTLEGEYTQGAAFEAADGTLYFGGIDGFNVLHPKKLISSTGETFRPLFTALRLRGEEIRPDGQYDGHILLAEAAPYTQELAFAYNQNFLTFEFSALNYLNPAQTNYRYQLKGIDPDWRETVTDGILRASYTNLPSGKYILQVMASDGSRRWDGEVTELRITIHAPWWKTTTAYILYALTFLILLAASVYLYIYSTKKKLERQHKEEILLLRIRNLIEQCNQYEASASLGRGQTSSLNQDELLSLDEGETGVQANTEESTAQTDVSSSLADSQFLSRAMEQVERNLDTAGYSVEQLSRDLCMDRTGLYRKLIALLDESPSLFIRNIRLRRAAQLLQEGNLSIAEIAEQVGFSTSSYLSKCFQEMYGCRPSEYVEKSKKLI